MIGSMDVARSLEEALAVLRRDPSRSVEVEVEGLHVELRIKPRRSAADVFREIGPWEGETTEQLLERLDDARRAGGSKEPPEL